MPGRAYAGPRVAQASPVAVTLVGKPPGQKGFAVQPRRWVVERSFAWFGRCRRLARDHEATTSSAVAFFTLAATMILVRRMAQPLCNGLLIRTMVTLRLSTPSLPIRPKRTNL